MSSYSHYQERNTKPRGRSLTDNFHQWSNGGKIVPAERRTDGANSNISPQPMYQNYAQHVYNQQPHSIEQSSQHQQTTSYNPRSFGYGVPPALLGPTRNRKVVPQKDVNEIKAKIVQARIRNLAIKRAIVQQNLKTNHTFSEQVPSESSKALLISTSQDDIEVPPSDITDSINDLEAQVERAKNNNLRKIPSSLQQKTKDASSSDFKTEIAQDSKEEINHSSNESANMNTSKRPHVPMLPLGNPENSDDITKKNNLTQPLGVFSNRTFEGDKMKKKKKREKKAKIQLEKLSKEDEELAESLNKVMDNINKEIQNNKAIIGENDTKKPVSSRVEGGLNAPLDSYRMKELRRNEERKKRAEARAKIDSLLNNDKLEFKIPRWRHELNGNKNPKSEQILKGKSLFRLVARLVLYFYAKPIVRVRIMRIMGRDALKEDFTKSILLSLDTCASWLTAITKVPLSSIVQDQTLTLSGLQAKEPKGKKGFHQQCNLQLKVRVTAMVNSVTKVDVNDVPQHIKSFLERLVSDGNFFRTDFLFGFEKSSLEFDSLGASNNVTKALSNEDILARAKEKLAEKGEEEESYTRSDADECIVVGDKTYMLSRAKMLIRMFLFLRVFVMNVLLSPWDHGIGPKPVQKPKKIVDNLRMAATIFYAMLRLYQRNMPVVSIGNRRKTIQTMKGGRFGSIREVFAVGPDTAPHNTSNLVIKRQATVASNANEDDDEKDKDGEGADGTHEVSNSNPKKKVPAWLTSLADKVLGEAQALNPNEGDDTTNFLLRNRPPFDNNIEHLHVFLIGNSQLEPVKPMIEPWMKESAKKLETWIDALSRLIVKDMKIKYQQDHDT